MAPICSILDVEFRNLIEEHEPSAKEDINGNEGFVWVDSIYEERKDRNLDSPEYEVFILEEMADIMKRLKGLMKTGARGHVFRSQHQCTISYKAPVC